MRLQALLLALVISQAACSSMPHSAASTEPAPAVPAAISAYFAGLDTIFRAGSTAQNIDAFFMQFHDSVQYLHLNYQAEFDRDAWHAAFTRNHQAGRYTSPANQCSVVTNAIPGLNYHAIEYAYGTLDANRCIPRDDERLLILFGFTEGRISLVQELW